MAKKIKGFTLLETILVIGIITMLLTAVYTVYQKQHISFLVEKQAKYVNEIITALDDYFLTTSGSDTSGNATISNLVNPPTQLISERLIPEEMISTTSSIQTVWGSPASINAINLDVTPLDGISNSVAGYEISLTNIPSTACSKLASQSFIVKNSQRITVNGTIVKSPGVSEVDPSLIGASCINANNTINIASSAFKHGIDPVVNSNASAYVRNKEGKYYIPPTGSSTLTSGSPSCINGSTWNAGISACVCSSTTKWNGTSCVPMGGTAPDQAGNCNVGQFWNQVSRTCQTICPVGQVYNPITNACVSSVSCPAGQVYSSITNACVSSPAAFTATKTLCMPSLNPINPNTPNTCITVNNQVPTTYQYSGGRNIPSNVLTPISPAFASIPTDPTMTAQIGNSMPATTEIAKPGSSLTCPVGARPTYAVRPNNANGTTQTVPIAQFDGKVCQMCINGFWDGDRCVTR